MEMEHINENTIRVLIENEDLAERGITFLDLLGNHKQIESFFYSILEEVDVEEQFQETDAITFQVLPNRDGLELFISKNNSTSEGMNLTELSEGMNSDELTEFVKSQMMKEATEDSTEEHEDTIEKKYTEEVFRLASFEEMVQLAKEVYLQNVQTNLYEMNNEYFLQVTFYTDELSDEAIHDAKAQLLEFSRKTKTTPEILSEYGQLIMRQTALELTRHYFK